MWFNIEVLKACLKACQNEPLEVVSSFNLITRPFLLTVLGQIPLLKPKECTRLDETMIKFDLAMIITACLFFQDTTYCQPDYDFPSQYDVITKTVDIVTNHLVSFFVFIPFQTADFTLIKFQIVRCKSTSIWLLCRFGVNSSLLFTMGIGNLTI